MPIYLSLCTVQLLPKLVAPGFGLLRHLLCQKPSAPSVDTHATGILACLSFFVGLCDIKCFGGLHDRTSSAFTSSRAKIRSEWITLTLSHSQHLKVFVQHRAFSQHGVDFRTATFGPHLQKSKKITGTRVRMNSELQSFCSPSFVFPDSFRT